MNISRSWDSYRTSLFLWAGSRQKPGPDKTYLYYFNFALPGPDKLKFRVFAASEIPYVMRSLSASNRPFGPEDYAISDMMSSYWVNFAKSGNPNGPGWPVWPAYDPNQKLVMKLDDHSVPIPAATEQRFDFFKRFFASAPVACHFAQKCSIGLQ